MQKEGKLFEDRFGPGNESSHRKTGRLSPMIGLDTSVIVRYVMRDDPKQSRELLFGPVAKDTAQVRTATYQPRRWSAA